MNTIEFEYARLKALADAATPPPWKRGSGTTNYRIYGQMRNIAESPQLRHRTRAGDILAESDGRANAAFIAAAHDMMALIAALRAELRFKETYERDAPLNSDATYPYDLAPDQMDLFNPRDLCRP